MKTLVLALIFTSITFASAQKTSVKEAKEPSKSVEEVKTPNNAKDSSVIETSSPAGDEETTSPEKKAVEPKTNEPVAKINDSNDEKSSIAPPAFKGPDLIHMPSTSNLQKDILNFNFNHRFGSAKAPLYDFLGLDKGANTQLSLDYGLTDKLSVGISRYTAFKTYEARTKYSIISQSNSFPVSISVLGVAGLETEKQKVSIGPYIIPPSSGYPAVDSTLKTKLNEYELNYTERTSYLASIMISRRFGERFSLQASPMFSHRNFVKSDMSNNRLGLDVAAKVQINKSFAFIMEFLLTQKRDYVGERYATVDQNGYGNINTLLPGEINSSYYKSSDIPYLYLRNVYNDKPVPHNYIPLSLGLSFESGGHIYNVFVTNSRALAQTQLLRGADFDYRNRDWTIGFNINRFFSFAKEVTEENF